MTAKRGEVLPSTLFRLLDDTGVPLCIVWNYVGCTRMTVYNWRDGGKVSAVYRPAVRELITLLRLGLKAGFLPQIPQRHAYYHLALLASKRLSTK